jgi:protein subunit release factor B
MAKTFVFAVTAADCRWDTFRAGGKGGQHQNKTESGVRCVHEPSGAIGEARDERSQNTNRRRAFRRMAESDRFRRWVALEAKRRVAQEQSIEDMINREVNAQMIESHLRVEGRDSDGNWITLESGLDA